MHSLAVTSDGLAWSWGYNVYGALGNGTTMSSDEPGPVSDLTGVVSVAGGGLHSVALRSDGTVWSWGYNESGQLGNGTNVDSTVPVQVSGLSDAVAVTSGDADFSFALLANGTVWGWGYNYYGELGNGANTNSNVPVEVKGLSTARAIAAGQVNGFAVVRGT